MQIYDVPNSNVILLIIFITSVCSKCVENNMISVSKQSSKRLSPTVSAILLECPPKKEKCERKVLVNVRVTPSMKLDKDEKFIILDELYDTKRKARRKILSPYVIQLSRDPPVQMFPLEFTKEVRCDKCADNNPQENGIRKLLNNNLNEPETFNDKLNKDVENLLKQSPITVDRRNFKQVEKDVISSGQRDKNNVPSNNLNENIKEHLVNKGNGNQKHKHEEQLNLQWQEPLKQQQTQHFNLQNDLDKLIQEQNDYTRNEKVRTLENQPLQQSSTDKQQKTQQLEKQEHSEDESLLNLQSKINQQLKPLGVQQRQIQQLQLQRELEKLIQLQSEDLSQQIVHTQQKKTVQQASTHQQRQTQQLQEQLEKLIQRQNEDIQKDQLKSIKLDEQHDKVQFKDDEDFSSEGTGILKKKSISKIKSNSEVMHDDLDKLIDDDSKDINEKLFKELEKLEAQPNLITEDEIKFEEDYYVGLEPRSCIKSNCLKTKSFKKESLKRLTKKTDKPKIEARKVHFHKRKHKKPGIQKEEEKLLTDKPTEEKPNLNTKENVVDVKENSVMKQIIDNIEKSTENSEENFEKEENLENEPNLKTELNGLNPDKNRLNLANVKLTEKEKLNLQNEQSKQKSQQNLNNLQNKKFEQILAYKHKTENNARKLTNFPNVKEIEEPSLDHDEQFDLPMQESTSSDDSGQPNHRWSVKTRKPATNKKVKMNNIFNAPIDKKLTEINRVNHNQHKDQNQVKSEKSNKDNMLQNVQLRKLTSMNSVQSSGSRNYKYINRIPFIESIVRPARKNKFHSILKYPRNIDYIPYNKAQDSSIQNKVYTEDINDKNDRDTINTFYTTDNGFYGSVNVDSIKNAADSGLNLDNPSNNDTEDDVTCTKCSNIRRSPIQSELGKKKKRKFTENQHSALGNLLKLKHENDKFNFQNKLNNNYLVNSPNRYKGIAVHSRTKTSSNSNNSPKKVRHKKIKQPNKNIFDNSKMDSDKIEDEEKNSADTNSNSGFNSNWAVIRLQHDNQRNKLCGSSACSGENQPVKAHNSCNECDNTNKLNSQPAMKMGNCNNNGCQSSDLEDDEPITDEDSGNSEAGCSSCDNLNNNKNQNEMRSSCGTCNSNNFNKDELIKDDLRCNSCGASQTVQHESNERSCNQCESTDSPQIDVCENLNMSSKDKNGTDSENSSQIDPNKVVGEADLDTIDISGGCDSSGGCSGSDINIENPSVQGNSNVDENESGKNSRSYGSCGKGGCGDNSNNQKAVSGKSYHRSNLNKLGVRNNQLNGQPKEYSKPIKRLNRAFFSNYGVVDSLVRNNDKYSPSINEEDAKKYDHTDKRNNQEKNINSKFKDSRVDPLNDDYQQSVIDEATDINKREALFSDKDESNNLKTNNFDDYMTDPSLTDYSLENQNDNIMRRSINENSDSQLTNSKETDSDQIQTGHNLFLNKNENDKYYESTGLFNNVQPGTSKLEKRTEPDTTKNNQLYSTIFGDKNLEFRDKINLLNSLQLHVPKNKFVTDTDIDAIQGDSQQTPVIDAKKKRSFMLSNDYTDYYDLDNLNEPLELQSNVDDIEMDSNLQKRLCTLCGSTDIPMTRLSDNTYMCNSCARQMRSIDNNVESNNEERICEKCGGKIGSLDSSEACHCARNERNEESLNDDQLNLENLNDNFEEANLINNNNLDSSFKDDLINDFNEQKFHQSMNDRRKRSAPDICLTSLSAIYANDDLSIIFSSHVDIFKPDRPLKILQNHKLLVPKYNNDNETVKINDNLIAVDGNKYDLNTNSVDAIRKICNIVSLYQGDSNREYRDINQDVINLGDFGYFPTHMNVLEKCKNDNTHLCLNMIDEQVPAYSVKIEFPFRQNDIIPDDILQIRITDIITDATRWGILQVTVFVINEGLVAHDFIIDIKSNGIICPSIQSFVTKTLLPHISESVTFLLPLEDNKPKQYNARVEVQTLKNETVATRNMIIQPTARCFCIWKCNCHCASNLASSNDKDICHILPKRQVDLAGFSINRRCATCPFWDIIIPIVIFLIIIAFLLGLIKALWGCTCKKVNKFGYDYIQPMHRYDYSSVYRRFFINILFFLVIPFIYCCKCFTPNEEDELLQNNTSEWGCSIQQRTYDEDSNTDYDNYRKYAGGTDDDDDDDETTILSQHIEKFADGSSNHRIDVNIFDSPYDENDTDANDLNAVLECNQAIAEMSAEHSSEEISEFDSRALEAIKLVRKLIEAKIVYRTLQITLGNVVVPTGHQYSIRGYFVPSLGTGYQFFTPVPLRQYYIICPESHTLRGIVPPNIIDSRAFTKNYCNRIEVLDAGDLSLCPSMDAPCVNVLAQDRKMYSDAKFKQ